MLMLVYDMFITWATGCMCNTSRVQSSLEPKIDESVAPNNAMTPRTGQWSMEAKNKIKLETKFGSQYS